MWFSSEAVLERTEVWSWKEEESEESVEMQS
jgi:hypothetical protein